jgi:hypothetical protein
MKPWHMLLCLAFVVAGVVLVAVGASAFAFLPILGCAAMMGAMVWMMMRSGGPGGG